jgi:hypothetical protein
VFLIFGFCESCYVRSFLEVPIHSGFAPCPLTLTPPAQVTTHMVNRSTERAGACVLFVEFGLLSALRARIVCLFEKNENE